MRHFRWFLNHVCPGPLNKNASPTKVTVLEEMIRMMYVSSTGTTPSCMEVTFNRFFPSKINDFAHWHENPRQIFAFFSALSPTFPLSSNQMPHGQNIHFADWLALFGFFTSNICAMKKTLIFQWVNHHFSRQKNLQTFLTPIKFLFSKSQIFCTKIIKNHKTCVSISSMSRLEN